MRIDKFLWSVRFYKTRSIAAEEIKKNRVSVGDHAVKSSKEVKIGDLIKVRKNQIDYQIKVIELPKSRVSAKLVPTYVQDRTDEKQYEQLKLRRMEQSYYRSKGEGRPTKKDRREIQDYTTGEPSDSDKNEAPLNDPEYWQDFFKSDLDE